MRARARVPGDGLEMDTETPSIGGGPHPRPWIPGGTPLSPEPVHVLVLYSHPLMGEGLSRMLAAEPGIEVEAVDSSASGAVDEALAREPAVIVVEEGGALDAADLMRRSDCPVVLDVDITTTRAWTLRRESMSSRPDDFLAEIRAAVGARVKADRLTATSAVREPAALPESDQDRRAVTIPG